MNQDHTVAFVGVALVVVAWLVFCWLMATAALRRSSASKASKSSSTAKPSSGAKRSWEVGRLVTTVTEKSGKVWKVVHTGFVVDDATVVAAREDVFMDWLSRLGGLLWVDRGVFIPLCNVAMIKNGVLESFVVTEDDKRPNCAGTLSFQEVMGAEMEDSAVANPQGSETLEGGEAAEGEAP